MKKSVSPVFAGIVIVIALALGILYFMTRYRAHEVQWQLEKAALKVQNERALSMRESSDDRPGGGVRRGMPGGTRSGEPGKAPGGEPGRSGAARSGE